MGLTLESVYDYVYNQKTCQKQCRVVKEQNIGICWWRWANDRTIVENKKNQTFHKRVFGYFYFIIFN